jgi:very-short-patch-repair endonuclease
MKKDTLESFKHKVKNQVGMEYTVLGNDYINSKTKILIRHNKCGHEYLVAPNTFNNGRRCPKCSGSIRLTEKNLIKRLEIELDNEYSVLDYSGYANKSSIFKHNKCGHEFKMRANNLLNQKNSCPYCSGKGTWTEEMFKRKLEETVGDEYSLISPYTNTRTKIKLRHNKCGHEWDVKANNFISKSVASRCPICSKKVSKGERKIIQFLEKNNILFEFDSKLFNTDLRVDIIIDSLNLIIEYDGIQHFKEKSLFESIDVIRERDNRKNNIIQLSKYTLLRLSYKNYKQLENILEELILRKKFNDYRNASTIEAYWKRKTDIYVQ